MAFLNTKDPELRDLMQGVAMAASKLREQERTDLAVQISDRVLVGAGFKKP